MLSTIKGNNYEILPDDERFPVKMNKKKTDAALAKLSKAMKTVNETLMDLYNSNPDLYYILRDSVLDGSCIRTEDDGYIWSLKYAAEEIDALAERWQTANDEIPKVEDIQTVEDFGYKPDHPGSKFYEKPISFEGDTEITDELVFDAAGAIRRERTILWENTSYGRSSKKITYRALPISKKLAKAINNTRKLSKGE